MPITNKIDNVDEEYDIIVVGGGSAGCVLAGKLSEATRQHGLSILLVESGRNSHNDRNVMLPGRYGANLSPTSGYFDFIKARLEHCGGREVAVAVPNILGGGGALNFLMYTRASESDYNDWKMDGWYTEDLIPLLRKLENYQNPRDPSPNKAVHGFSGPFAISQGPNDVEPNKIAIEVHSAAEELGYPVIPDMNDLKQGLGFSEWPKWIDPVTGYRQDPAHRYIHPYTGDSKTGLTVLCEHKCVRTIVKNGRATAVEIVHTVTAKADLPSTALHSANTEVEEVQQPSIDPTSVRTIRARKLIVISAGSVNTPPILERSGIGAPEVLRKAGVECIVDLPGVGGNLQDHLGAPTFYRFDKDLPHSNDYLNGDAVAVQKADEGLKHNRGAHLTNYVPSAAKIRPTEEELQETSPEFQKLWDDFYRDAPDKPLFIQATLERGYADLLPFLTSEYGYIAFIPYTMYPVSRGSIHITSSSISALPDFAPAYLLDPRDMPPHVLGYKQHRELARRMPSFRGEVREAHPAFPETSPARCIDYPTAEQRAEMARTKVAYTDEDNKAIEAWVRNSFIAVWHWLGTSAMKPREQKGVVDARLNVYGVEGLKVADLSICPENVGSNTYNTALLIGSKAAELVAEDLGLGYPEKWIESQESS